MITVALAVGFVVLLVLLYFVVKASRQNARQGMSSIATKRAYSGEPEGKRPRSTGSGDN